MNQNYITLKTLLIGDVAIGKSSLMLRFVKETFDDNYTVTVGVECLVKKVQTDSGSCVAIQLWDTAGHERFRSIVKSFFKDSGAILICFSLNNRETLKNVKGWHKLATESTDSDPFFILVGTQSDLDNVVSVEEANAVAKEIGAKGCVFTSAKEDTGVVEKTADIAIGEKEAAPHKPLVEKRGEMLKLGEDLRMPREARKRKRDKCKC